MEEKNDIVYFGRCDYRNSNRLFGIKRRDRRQHMYVIGKTGVGKSALLHNIIVQDIARGEGVCVVDPHGELVESVLEKIPKERANDVVYFNPADTESHMGFNPLELPNPEYKHLAASGLMAIFTKIWANVWSARMEYILNNCILALLDTPDSTLLGITRLLVDKEYRKTVVRNIQDPVVKAFWVNEYESWQDRFRNEAIAPIQNKVGAFLATPLVRNVVGQPKSTIDVFDMMNSGKIFLVNVSKGKIGEDNSALLGAMLITKIQLTAMERVRIPEEERKDYYLYVDEFQNFATDSFASVLSEARKYRLNLIIAHQYIGQLVTDVSTKVRDAVFGNVGTMITFRVGAADAEFLEKEFEPEFEIQDIVNIPNYHIYLKLMVDGVTCRPFSAKTLPPFKMPTEAVSIDKIVEMSRQKYAKPRVEVEEKINEWSGNLDLDAVLEKKEQKSKKKGEGLHPAQCSSCGKDTRVPFKPSPEKPVYCPTCLEKVRAGEIMPARVQNQTPRPPSPSIKSAEYTPTSSSPPPPIVKPTEEHAPTPSPLSPDRSRIAPPPVRRIPQKSIADAEESAKKASSERVSLGELLPESKKKDNNDGERDRETPESTEKKGVEVDDLRSALKNALKRKDEK